MYFHLLEQQNIYFFELMGLAHYISHLGLLIEIELILLKFTIFFKKYIKKQQLNHNLFIKYIVY